MVRVADANLDEIGEIASDLVTLLHFRQGSHAFDEGSLVSGFVDEHLNEGA